MKGYVVARQREVAAVSGTKGIVGTIAILKVPYTIATCFCAITHCFLLLRKVSIAAFKPGL
jgi:hypothetical protein